ncbi:Cytochrome monooxygenase adrA like protein [Verticillium longisporum]|nr:Cytochrome monooxygenase adrA like protein [Verticillium longisporum]
MTVIKSYLSSPEFISHIGGVLLAIASLYAWSFWTREAFYPGILLEGAKKSNTCFQVVTANGPRIIFPSRYVNELRSIKSLSLSEIFRKELFADYPGFDPIRLVTETDVIPTTVRTKLTSFLVPVSGALRDESAYAIERLFGSSDHWVSFDIHTHATGLVSRLSTRAFMGEVLCRDDEWLTIAADWTMVLMDAARALHMWPGIFKPIVHWFLPECRLLRKTRNKATIVVERELTRRRERERASNSKPSTVKVGDTLGWMQEVAGSENIDLAGGQLVLTFASIHTTSDLLTKCLYNLSAHPEYQNLLRKEIITVLSEKGWDKTSLYQLKLLDSFMKETQRLMPTSVRLMNRVAQQKVTLNDGTIIPKGAILSIIQDRLFDPDVYPEPQKFDGYRFLKLRSQPGQEAHWQLVTTSTDHTGFGHGIHACPGRFFAATELKVALCFLLLRYDWQQDCDSDTAPTFQHGSEIMANPDFKISFRRRQEEVDIMNLVKHV